MSKRKLDRFDLEAEREGAAIEHSRKEAIKKPIARRLARQRASATKGDIRLDNRAAMRHMR